MEEQKRHSGFETMRILSMVMIVLMHGIGHGGLGSAAPQGSAAFWIYWLLFILARVSTNCFVMLSGYYLSERKGAVRAGRLFRIGAQVWFYSMLTFCVAVKAGTLFPYTTLFRAYHCKRLPHNHHKNHTVFLPMLLPLLLLRLPPTMLHASHRFL